MRPRRKMSKREYINRLEQYNLEICDCKQALETVGLQAKKAIAEALKQYNQVKLDNKRKVADARKQLNGILMRRRQFIKYHKEL